MAQSKQYKIATGLSRKDRNWNNQEMTWEEFLENIRETKRTQETLKEYKGASATQRGDIKDVGGFVAGYVKGGRRTAQNIESRSMVTLDIDFADNSFWQEFALIHPYKAALYTTHSHTDKSPRYRLIIPINRDVSPDEYTAISRKVSEEIGIEYFDTTTHQANRLMYWPSTSRDAEYVMESTDGVEIDADAVLASYDDWTDVAQWPTSSKEDKLTESRGSKQQDPTKKDGLIGAFCRAYTIKDAIDTFLNDVYTPTYDPNRYTFTKGSSMGGLVLYDNLYAYSNHGTDPASQQTCNAFDLVRIHKFGQQDDESKEDTPVNRLPSYKAMHDFISQDDGVLTEIASAEIRNNFADKNMSKEEIDKEAEWVKTLKRNKNEKVESTTPNAVIILENHEPLKGKFAYDTFAHRSVAKGDLPWRKVDANSRDLKDSDDAELRYYMEKYFDISNTSKIDDALVHISQKNAYNPIVDYLEELTWDGTERLDTLLIDYMNADDNEYVRAVTRKTLTAAVARVYKPGCKFDYMLTLVGAQGIGKSTLFAQLAGQEYFSDSITNPGSKDSYEQLQGVWINEVAELAAMKNSDVETMKNFISKTSDRYRVAYGKRTENFPRQGILVGSTNEHAFLRDRTGNRRFWAVEVYQPKESIMDVMVQPLIDQIWAEAKHRYDMGEELFLNRELEAMATAQQNMFSEDNGNEGIIHEYLEMLLPENWYDMSIEERRAYIRSDRSDGVDKRQRVCAKEIAVELFGRDMDEASPGIIRDINISIRNHEDWNSGSKTISFGKLYGKQRGFERVSQ